MSIINRKTTFWRRCLADTVFEAGCRPQQKHGLIAQPMSCRERGIVETLPPPPKHTRLAGADRQPSTRTEPQALTLFPEAWVLKHDHGLTSTRHGDEAGSSPMWLPFALPVLLDRHSRRLWPAAQPYIPRDLLAPDWESSDQPIMALLHDHDTFRSAHPFAPAPPVTLPEPCTAAPGSPEFQRQLEEVEKAHRTAWSSAMAYLDALREAACATHRSALESGALIPLAEVPTGGGACFLSSDALSDAAIRQQVRVFDELLDHTTEAPALYRRFAADAPADERPLLDDLQGFGQRLAHSTGRHPLAEAQRHAMNHLVLGTGDGEMLAINGPPGTGKTTLLLSIVANLWTQAAREAARRPPIIVGASATNQAVTNIIAAFHKDFDAGSGPLAGRWLPDSLVWSYGTYRPSTRALRRAKQQATQAMQDHSAPMYFQELLERLTDRERLATAMAEYNSHGGAWISTVPDLGNSETLHDLEPSATTRYLVDALHQDICQRSQAIDALRATLETLPALHQACQDTDQALAHSRQAVESEQVQQAQARQTLEALGHTRDGLTQALAQAPSWLSLFDFLPPVRRKLEAVVLSSEAVEAATLHERLAATGKAAGQRGRLEAVMTRLDADIIAATQAVRDTETRHAACRAEVEQQRRHHAELHARLDRCWQQLDEHFEADSPVGILLGHRDWSARADELVASADAALEPTQRFTLFRLATHYWEGRALLEAEELLALDHDQLKRLKQIPAGGGWHPKPGELERVLGLYAMVAPAIVSTFSALPSLFQVYRGGRQTLAFGLADLLIVDEAGQVSPEVAAPGFALAKRALVVGDTQQIAPVATLGETLERQNLAESRLITATDDDAGVAAINTLGQGPTQGSVMYIAQQACAYHYLRRQRGTTGGPPGMFLDEHRRCFDEIIDYCNALCYEGLLTPKRGAAQAPLQTDAAPGPESGDRPTLRLAQLQPLSYWHIDGQCQMHGTSRVNETEALAISQWIAEHAEAMVARYQEGERPVALSSLVAVVTPFKAQAEAIKRQLRQTLGEEAASQLTVGTVHSLQGAERRVVLFSGVYAGTVDGRFIDRSRSMLNVAVSRAKDHFIFVGDMHLLGRQPDSSPRGLLYRYLTRHPGGDIPMAFTPRIDDTDASTIEVIFEHADHDALMFAAIANARQQICILSPWVLQRELERAELVQALEALRRRTGATSRQIPVRIYLDEVFSSAKWKDRRLGFHDYLQAFADRYGVTFRLCRHLHAKMLLVDQDLYACGSLNWLSADRNGAYRMLESSSVVRGPQARPLISRASETLATLRDSSPTITASDSVSAP
ncbi:AAA domain-containing protein [Halomonas borealis]|uniref:AAA domain-containing protein n=1 Tax=Halomonas borealis TaxID=2508710 RepID=UPI00109F362D|nr:AAA domain-containing protein [Halomonas borealis]